MKRSIFISIIAILAAVACVNSEQDLDVVVGGRKIETFTAKIADDNSRTMSILGADGVLNIFWHPTDSVAVTDGSQLAKYRLDSGAGSDVATFVVDDESKGVAFDSSKPLYGVSPWSATSFTDSPAGGTLPSLGVEDTPWDDTRAASSFEGILRVNIPTEQGYSGIAGHSDRDRNIMVGTTADNGQTFEFKMVASAARFDIKVAKDEKILSVTMSAESAKLSGAATVDVATLTIAKASENSVTLNYHNPEKGTTTDGWALVAPVAWTATDGKVFYSVATDSGTYTFCKRPTKNFEAGYIYTLKLDIEKFSAVTSYDKLEDGCYYFESKMAVKQV